MPALQLAKAGRHAVMLEYRYRVAGLPWCTSQPINLLAPFLTASSDGAAEYRTHFRFADQGCERATKGLLVGASRRIRARYRDDGCLLAVEGLGSFQVNPDRILYPEIGPGTSSSMIGETLLGPPLLLALAGNRRFTLHAGAVRFANRALWLFLGDSGMGKSTLAAYADAQPLCQRVADDLLPVCWNEGRLWALPWYPQLKLGHKGQIDVSEVPEKLEVSGIYQLNPVPATDAVAVEPLSRHEALRILIRQTVSARLFSPALLAAHFDDCARMVETLPAYRLNVPCRLERLGEVYRTLNQVAATDRRLSNPS